MSCPRRPLTAAQRQARLAQVTALRAQGLTWAEVAERIGVRDANAACRLVPRQAAPTPPGAPMSLEANEGRCPAIGPPPESFRCGQYVHHDNEHTALGPSWAPWFGGSGHLR